MQTVQLGSTSDSSRRCFFISPGLRVALQLPTILVQAISMVSTGLCSYMKMLCSTPGNFWQLLQLQLLLRPLYHLCQLFLGLLGTDPLQGVSLKGTGTQSAGGVTGGVAGKAGLGDLGLS
jgi:hypothetical protein